MPFFWGGGSHQDWLRSGHESNYNNAYVLNADGSDIASGNVNNPYGVRPALHSNLQNYISGK